MYLVFIFSRRSSECQKTYFGSLWRLHLQAKRFLVVTNYPNHLLLSLGGDN